MTGPTDSPFDKQGGQNYPPPGGGYPPPGGPSYQNYQPPGYQPGYQPPGYQPGYQPVRRNGFGLAALVLGFLSILLFFTFGFGIVLGITGVVLGLLGLGRVKRGEADNRGVAVTGVVLSGLGIIVGIAFFFFVGWLINSLGLGDLTSCLQRAGNDQSAIQQCQDEYATNIENRFDITLTPFPTR